MNDYIISYVMIMLGLVSGIGIELINKSNNAIVGIGLIIYLLACVIAIMFYNIKMGEN